MLIGVSSAWAQEEGFTEEELKKYARVMKWAEMEKKKMGEEVAAMVKDSENLSGGAYKKLKKAAKTGDLSSADVTEEEIAEFRKIQEATEKRKAEFKETYIDKIKSDIGAGLYNRLNKALKSDEEVKVRYEAIYKLEPVTVKGDKTEEDS